MKEATGELNATIFVVLAVSILMAFFYFTIWPMINQNFNEQTNCSKAICGKCTNPPCDTVSCYYRDKNTNEEKPIECVYKG